MTPAQVFRIRKAIRVSRQKFADMLGTEQVTVARWEEGLDQPTGFYLKALTELDMELSRQPLIRFRGDDPLPMEFNISLILDYGLSGDWEWRALEDAFTPAWEKTWERIAGRTTDRWYDGSIISEKKNHYAFPGAFKRYYNFKAKDGFLFLKNLADRGADANLILCLFVKYLWNDNVSRTEHTGQWIKSLQEEIKAVQITKRIYTSYYKKPFDTLKTTTDPIRREVNEWFIDAFGGEYKEEVEETLCEMEWKLRRLLEGKDFRDSGKRRPPNDKANRVIFTVYEHVKQRTGGPRWKVLADLLGAADAIAAGVKKANGQKNKVTESPDRRIWAHIKSFEKDHPNEAKMIPVTIRDWPAIPKPPSR